MGKKSHNKPHVRGNLPVSEPTNSDTPKKLSKQKRNDVNQLIEKLLKVSALVQSSSNVSKEWEIHLEVKKILDKIINIESEMKVAVPDRSNGFKQFMNWMVENGAQIEGLSISQFPDYDYGLKAEREFQKRDVILSVPRKVMLTVDNARDSILGYNIPLVVKAILRPYNTFPYIHKSSEGDKGGMRNGPLMKKDAMLQHMPNIVLALYLLIEKFNPDSFWKSYISILPSSYTTVLYFSTSEFQELKGSPTLEPALRQCRNIARQYAYFNKLFQNSTDPACEALRDVFTYEQYRWAVSTVMTRQNFIPSMYDTSLANALIPMWDMCNHDNGKVSTDFSPEADCGICYAERDYRPGDQVFIFYGMRPNSDYMVHNGFVFLRNIFDSVKLKLGVSKADPLSSLKTKLLGNLRLPVSGEFYLKIGADPVEGLLLAFLRVFSMGQDDLEHWLNSERCSDLMYPDCALNTEVESKAWNFLLTRIKLLISAYPTTLERDEELLRNGGLTPCRKLGIELRASEKKILHNALLYVEQRIKS